MPRLSRRFFMRAPVTCASELIGCRLHWQGCTGRIVETEAYDANDDPACHTWFRKSACTFIQEHQPGDAYVYLNYGVHWLFNILVKGTHRSGFVLVRAIEPLSGVELMRMRRPGVDDHRLGAGPGRLTRALGIDGAAHGVSFLASSDCGISLGKTSSRVSGARIGISRATHLLWRFGDPNSPALSRAFE